ncbi:MAG: hypothetical protein ABSF18_03600 [Gammaproteobacteria bacterium]|jgi:hypothetical protein
MKNIINLADSWILAIEQYEQQVASINSNKYRWLSLDEKTQALLAMKKELSRKLQEMVIDAINPARNGTTVTVPACKDFLRGIAHLNIEETQNIINGFLQIPTWTSFIYVGLEERGEENEKAENIEDRGYENIEENGMLGIFEDGIICEIPDGSYRQSWSKLSADQCIAIINNVVPDDATNENYKLAETKEAIHTILSCCNPPATAQQLSMLKSVCRIDIQESSRQNLNG